MIQDHYDITGGTIQLSHGSFYGERLYFPHLTIKKWSRQTVRDIQQLVRDSIDQDVPLQVSIPKLDKRAHRIITRIARLTYFGTQKKGFAKDVIYVNDVYRKFRKRVMQNAGLR